MRGEAPGLTQLTFQWKCELQNNEKLYNVMPSRARVDGEVKLGREMEGQQLLLQVV